MFAIKPKSLKSPVAEVFKHAGMIKLQMLGRKKVEINDDCNGNTWLKIAVVVVCVEKQEINFLEALFVFTAS